MNRKVKKVIGMLLACCLLLTCLPVGASAATVTASGTVTEHGSNLPWRLYSDGTLRVNSGFINWPGHGDGYAGEMYSPWWPHQSSIRRVIITGPISARAIDVLFAGLINVTTMEGLEHIDTSDVTSMLYTFGVLESLTRLDLSAWDTRNVGSMHGMFMGASSLTSLDVSGWDTRNVGDMEWMFGFTGLTSLDLSGWDTSNVQWMTGMFSGSDSLRRLTLGERFVFDPAEWFCPDLPPVPENAVFTGRWRNVGDGTANNPLGSHMLTSDELMTNFNGATMADTWVWQPVNPTHLLFDDVLGHWALRNMEFVFDNNLMQGVSSTAFAPDATLTRAQVVATLFRMEHGRTANGSDSRQMPFEDVSDWSVPYVAWAAANGIVTGIAADRFAPEDYVTREQFATMLFRYAGFAEHSTSVSVNFDLNRFEDRGEISDFASVAMGWANYNGLITGRTNTTLVPRGTATRAECATILMRYVQRFVE